MIIDVPDYKKDGFKYVWEKGFVINCSVEESGVLIKANKEGLISLARHLLELAQDEVPNFCHIHLNEFNSLEDGSEELTIVKE